MEQATNQSSALFLPFMQIPSGHHHVADALMNELTTCRQNLDCDKIDILSYSFGKMEKIVSATYLTWIKLLPSAYHWLYYHSAYKKIPKNKRYYVYESLFTYFFKRLLKEKRPGILFCTHALPSNIASILKQKDQLKAIVINVYTDYFVNRIWGVKGIDYHFVPTKAVKDYLINQGVMEHRIFITGIPVHAAFVKEKNQPAATKHLSILVTGGNLGVGALERLLTDSINGNRIQYHVLCGKNGKLYQQLKGEMNKNITPYSYISCREKMNDLYDQVDAVLTKPGGVTISESLLKQKPIFVYNALPGQEKINANHLNKQGLIMQLDMKNESVEKQIIDYFSDQTMQEMYKQKVTDYHQSLEKQPISELIDTIIEVAHESP